MHGGRDRRTPHTIFNLTNDSWHGNSVEPMEHLVQASLRAIEHRHPLVRATNTGISAIAVPVGRLDSRNGQWTNETLVGQVELMEGRTVYVILGDWIGCVCVALSLAELGRSVRIAQRPGRED